MIDRRIYRLALKRMSPRARAKLARLEAYRDNYQGKSCIERRDRERLVVEHIRRSA
jgi:hypothetical protein